MTSSIPPGHLRRTFGRDQWFAPYPFGPDGWRMVRKDEGASVVATVARFEDGHEWIHASIATTAGTPMPTYEDLATLHRAVFDDRPAFQVFAPPAEHINIHPNALHLWGRLDGTRVHPDFGKHGTI